MCGAEHRIHVCTMNDFGVGKNQKQTKTKNPHSDIVFYVLTFSPPINCWLPFGG